MNTVPQGHPNAWITRPKQWGWVELSGADAPDFLHRLTTADIRNLAVGVGTPACFLTAQGRIRVCFTLWRCTPDSFGMELEEGTPVEGAQGKWKKELLSTIDQYTFAEKFTISEQTSCRWIFGSNGGDALLALQTPDLAPGQTRLTWNGARICHHGTRDFGRTWITAWGSEAQLQELAQAVGAELTYESEIPELTWARVQALRPWPGAEIIETTLPLEAGMMDAIAQGKGCYPGQEVIERMISMGSPPRRLVLLEAERAPHPRAGQKIYAGEDPSPEVGLLTTVAEKEGKLLALGFVRKTHAKEGQKLRLGAPGAAGASATILGISS